MTHKLLETGQVFWDPNTFVEPKSFLAPEAFGPNGSLEPNFVLMNKIGFRSKFLGT